MSISIETIRNFINDLLQPTTATSNVLYDETVDTINLDNVNLTTDNEIMNIITGASFIVDSFIFEKLMSYIETRINYNELPFLTALLVCKLIQTKLNLNYQNYTKLTNTSNISNSPNPTDPTDSIDISPLSPYASNQNLISTYLTIYTKTIDFSSAAKILSADTLTSTILLDLVKNEPHKLTSFMTLSFIDKVEEYFNNLCLKYFENIPTNNNEIDPKIFENIYTSIPENDKNIFVNLSKNDTTNQLMSQFLSNTTNKQDIIDSVDNINYLSNILLILIVKSIAYNKNPYYIQMLIFLYLCNFGAQTSMNSGGICYVLASVFCRNALSRITGTPITNMKELREIYFNQFNKIIQNNPLIQLNEFTNNNYIEYKENILKQNNPFYQCLFNTYDVNMTKLREGFDNKNDAILYILKREKVFYQFLREQFKNRESEFAQKYDDITLLLRTSGLESPFKLNDNLFKQFYYKFTEFYTLYAKNLTRIPDAYDDDVNRYKHYDNVDDYDRTVKSRSNGSILHRVFLHGFCMLNKLRDTRNNGSCPYKFDTYNGELSTNKILSKFITINNGIVVSNSSNENDYLVHYNKKKYMVLVDGNIEILIDYAILRIFTMLINNPNYDEVEQRNIIIKICADYVASYIAADCINQDNGRNDLAVYVTYFTASSPLSFADGHIMCQVIQNGDNFIYDPNMIMSNSVDFSFNYYLKPLLVRNKLIKNDKNDEYVLKSNYRYIQDYPRLVRFLGGNRDEIMKLLVWFLIGVVVVIIVVVVIRCIKQSKCNCLNSLLF